MSKKKINDLIDEAIKQVNNIIDINYINAGMGVFEYEEDKSPSEIKREVIQILDNLRLS